MTLISSTLTLTLRPVEPGAVPQDVPTRRLLAAYEQRAHRAAIADQDGAGPVGHALTALALSVAITNRLRTVQWQHVEIALRAGASAAAVAAALGSTVGDLSVGYAIALQVRVQEGKLTTAEADELSALLDSCRRREQQG